MKMSDCTWQYQKYVRPETYLAQMQSLILNSLDENEKFHVSVYTLDGINIWTKLFFTFDTVITEYH